MDKHFVLSINEHGHASEITEIKDNCTIRVADGNLMIEEEKSEQIRVGDEVVWLGGTGELRAIVTMIDYTNHGAHLLYDDGSVEVDVLDDYARTGRHVDLSVLWKGGK